MTDSAQPKDSQPMDSQPMDLQPPYPYAADSQPAVVGPAGRPEVAVAGAFAGGLVLALILKRLGR